MKTDKEELERLIETLTEEQMEYIYHLILGLFGKTAN